MAKTAKVKEKKEGAPEKLLVWQDETMGFAMQIVRPDLGPRLTPETMAFSGCSITSGVGKGLVVDTGMSTRSLSQALMPASVNPIGTKEHTSPGCSFLMFDFDHVLY